MQLTRLTLVLATALFGSGCSSLVSLNEFVRAADGQADAGLVGVWADAEGSETYMVTLEGSVYTIKYYDKSSAPLRLEARLVQAGGATLLDVYPKEEAAFQQPVHAAMRVWLEGNSLRIAFLESDWLKKKAVDELPSQVVDGRTVITADSRTSGAFLRKYGACAEAYKDVAVLKRVF